MRSERLIAVLMLLQSRGRSTAAQIARELEVSERTILRDIDALSLSGVPVYAERGRHGGFSLLPGYRTDLTGLTLDEAISLLAGGGRIDSPAYAAAMRKVTAAIPEAHRPGVAAAAQRILIRPEGFVRPPPDLDALPPVQRAVLEGHRISAAYRSRIDTESRRRVLDPLGLILAGEVWYLAALHNADERIYRLDRMNDVEILDQPARRDQQVDLTELWERHRTQFRAGFDVLEVVVECRRAAVEVLRANAPTVDDTAIDNDRARCSLRFVGERAALVKLWALSGLPDLDLLVIEPADLARSIAERAATVSSTYRSAGGGATG